MHRSGFLALAATLVGADQFTYVDNGVIRVGIDATRGGSIGYLSASGSTYNVINTHDMGREIQLSFYAGPNPYNPNGRCNPPAWSPWPWNPIGAGDYFGNAGQILSVSNDGQHAEVASVPLQWACNNVSCECTFTQDIVLAPGATWISGMATIDNSRSDHKDYGAYGQEMPATYTIGDLYNLYAYTGNEPWTNAPVTNVPTPPAQPPWNPGVITVTENWAAFLDTNQWGMGVYSPSFSSMNTGFHGTPGGGSTDDSTGYIAPYGVVDLTWNVTYSYNYSIVLGNLATIRSFAYQAHAAGAQKRLGVFADFGEMNTRHVWVPAGGAGRVQGDESVLSLQLPSTGTNATMAGIIGPVQAWSAKEVPAVRIRMMHQQVVNTNDTGNMARFCVRPFGSNPFEAVPLPAGSSNVAAQSAVNDVPLRSRSLPPGATLRYADNFLDENCAAFSVVADGQWNEYEVQLAGEVQGYTGTMLQAKVELDTGGGVAHVAWIKPVLA